MQLLGALKVCDDSEEKSIEIYHGDLTDLGPDEAVDLLVISALPDDYLPTPDSLIGALNRKGVSVLLLANDKAEDLRDSFSCWLSKEIPPYKKMGFKRILCFEPPPGKNPPEVVGGIFRSLASFLYLQPRVEAVAMPLVACGGRHLPVRQMLEPLMEAAINSMTRGSPLKRLMIAVKSDLQAVELKREFLLLKNKYETFKPPSGRDIKYDVFLSYAHVDEIEARLIADEIKRLRPRSSVFLDRTSLKVGGAWQSEIFNSIDASRRFMALLSEPYVKSKICQEEFACALACRRDFNDDGFLFAVYLSSTELPRMMKDIVSYEDCRENDLDKLRGACKKLLGLS